MNSKLLKLEPPYNIIYAGGHIGRHIATLLTWEDPEPEELQIPYAASYAVIDQGNKMPAGTLVNDVQLEECRIVCKEDDLRINLRDFADLVKYDFEQSSPVEAGLMWEKLTNLGVEMVFDKIKGTDEEKSDYEVTLYFFGAGGYYKVDSNLANGFCFHAEGNADEVYNQLRYQHDIYVAMFWQHDLRISFVTNDGFDVEHGIVDRLNQLHE